MKNILTILFIATLVVTTQAQNIDKDRMHRDLEVAENALGTIVAPTNNRFPRLGFGDEDIKADYIKDYGVIFMVPNNGSGSGRLVAMFGSNDNDTKMQETKAPSDDENKNQFIVNSKIFLADYAGIIGQLDDSQMISIRKGGSDTHVDKIDLEKVYFAKKGLAPDEETIWASKMNAAADSELIIEASVGKINKLRMGKISRDDFFNSVTVVENVNDYSKDADLETLSAMFQRLYKKDLSKTFYSERTPQYSKLTNFGVIVKMKFYSSYEDNNVYSMPTISKKGLTLEERNKNVMELLPQFEADFKENLVNYARTLKNLDSEEVLLFEINMTTCKNCNNFPKVMKFSIKKSVLHKYNRGDLSMKDAIKKVDVERIVD